MHKQQLLTVCCSHLLFSDLVHFCGWNRRLLWRMRKCHTLPFPFPRRCKTERAWWRRSLVFFQILTLLASLGI